MLKNEEEFEDRSRQRIKKVDMFTQCLRQLLLNVSYFLVAVCVAIRGPTLLDLKDIYETDLEKISYGLVSLAIGGLFGVGCARYLTVKFVERLPRLVAVFLILLALSVAVTPHCKNLPLFYACMFLSGICLTFMHTAHPALCLSLWRGRNAAPFMHSLYFFFALGSFTAPLIAPPFLSGSSENATNDSDHHEDRRPFSSDVPTLFISLGAALALIAMPYFCFACCAFGNEFQRTSQACSRSDSVYSAREIVLIVLLITSSTLFCILEFGQVSFLPSFAVECELHLTKVQGSNLMALLFGIAAFSMPVVGLLSIKLSPNPILLGQCSLVTSGSLILLCWAERDRVLLHIGFALVGAGMGTMFANLLLWLEHHVPVTNQLTSYVIGVGCVGINAAPFLIGPLIEKLPMVFIYLHVAIIVVMDAALAAGFIIGRGIKTQRIENAPAEKSEWKEKVKMLA